MKNWWKQLSLREQRTLAVGGLAALVLLAYLAVWTPLEARRAALEQLIVRLQQDLAWMEGAAADLRRLPTDSPAAAGQTQSLLGLVDSSVREFGLAAGVRRVQPEGDRVRLWLEGVGFNDLLRWLAAVRESGTRIDSLAVDRRAEPGKVDGRVVLAREDA